MPLPQKAIENPTIAADAKDVQYSLSDLRVELTLILVEPMHRVASGLPKAPSACLLFKAGLNGGCRPVSLADMREVSEPLGRLSVHPAWEPDAVLRHIAIPETEHSQHLAAGQVPFVRILAVVVPAEMRHAFFLSTSTVSVLILA